MRYMRAHPVGCGWIRYRDRALDWEVTGNKPEKGEMDGELKGNTVKYIQ